MKRKLRDPINSLFSECEVCGGLGFISKYGYSECCHFCSGSPVIMPPEHVLLASWLGGTQAHAEPELQDLSSSGDWDATAVLVALTARRDADYHLRWFDDDALMEGLL